MMHQLNRGCCGVRLLLGLHRLVQVPAESGITCHPVRTAHSHPSSSIPTITQPPHALLKNPLYHQSAVSNNFPWKPLFSTGHLNSNLLTDGRTAVSIGSGNLLPAVFLTMSVPACVLNCSQALFPKAVSDLSSSWGGVECSSVLKKRRKKMNKHKYKKWLKKTRIKRRKLKK